MSCLRAATTVKVGIRCYAGYHSSPEACRRLEASGRLTEIAELTSGPANSGTELLLEILENDIFIFMSIGQLREANAHLDKLYNSRPKVIAELREIANENLTRVSPHPTVKEAQHEYVRRCLKAADKLEKSPDYFPLVLQMFATDALPFDDRGQPLTANANSTDIDELYKNRQTRRLRLSDSIDSGRKIYSVIDLVEMIARLRE